MIIHEFINVADTAGTWLSHTITALYAAPGTPTPTPSTSPSPVPAPSINTSGVVTFLATKISPILLAVLGIIFISRAGKGEVSRILTSSAIAFIGLAFIAGAASLFLFGKSLVHLVFPTP